MVTTRLISTHINNLPSFFNKYATDNYIIETSILDVKNKKFTLKSENIFLQNILKITENILYESNNDKTKMTQCFNISVNIFGKSMFEKLISENIKKNSVYGYNALNYLLENNLKDFVGPTNLPS